VVADGGYVERCHSCHGGISVRAGDREDPVTQHIAAREGVYLAEHVMRVREVSNIGHRADCARKGRAR
jgi:hypothetical protein